MNLIKLEGVCKRFGEKNLFNNLSMEIEQGEFVSIMGESGAGKTTLLNIIGMLEPPDVYKRQTMSIIKLIRRARKLNAYKK